MHVTMKRTVIDMSVSKISAIKTVVTVPDKFKPISVTYHATPSDALLTAACELRYNRAATAEIEINGVHFSMQVE